MEKTNEAHSDAKKRLQQMTIMLSKRLPVIAFYTSKAAKEAEELRSY